MEQNKNGNVRVAVYMRLATDPKDEEQKQLIELKKAILNEYCLKRGWTIPMNCYADVGLSGLNMDRPQLQRMLSAIKNGTVDVCLVESLSRLSRSLENFCEIQSLLDKHHVRLVSVQEGDISCSRISHWKKFSTV